MRTEWGDEINFLLVDEDTEAPKKPYSKLIEKSSRLSV